MGPTSAVQSVDRAARVLSALARDGESSVGAMARELGVHGSTASRLISALEAHDLVERVEGTGQVRLGIGLLRLAGATRDRFDLTTQARPVCDALAEELAETVNVAVFHDGAAINVYQAQGTSTVAMHNWAGSRTVLHATASGKMLMAYLPQAESDSLLGAPLERFTEHTVTDSDALRAQLHEAQRRGWACCVEEFEQGLNALAAPIRDLHGDVIAAVSVAGPAYRMEADSLPRTAEVLLRAAADISARMGHQPDPTG